MGLLYSDSVPPTIVDIADMKASNSGAILKTYALGSCIGVAAYDPVAKAGGLLHYMLPDSRLDDKKAKLKPFMFADTGIIQMFSVLKGYGCKSSNLIVKVAGGANIMDTNGTFNIGKRNFLALKKILWRFNIVIKKFDVGGNSGRDMMLNLDDFSVQIRHAGKKELETL